MINRTSSINWNAVFLPATPLLETFLRGTLTYIALFVLLRVILKRQSGTMAISDLLVLVLIADASQNAMAGNYTSITDGILLVATIMFWSMAIDWLGFHFRPVQRFFFPPPLLLVKDGVPLRNNMRKEFITRDELLGQLREQGIDDLRRVKEAFLEVDGHLSVILRDRE